jgi:hypothetical protein
MLAKDHDPAEEGRAQEQIELYFQVLQYFYFSITLFSEKEKRTLLCPGKMWGCTLYLFGRISG